MENNTHAIAVELENLLCKTFNINRRPHSTIFDADSIEHRTFYDVLELILFMKSKKEYYEFTNSICEYRGISMNKIPNVEKIYSEFESS